MRLMKLFDKLGCVAGTSHQGCLDRDMEPHVYLLCVSRQEGQDVRTACMQHPGCVAY